MQKLSITNSRKSEIQNTAITLDKKSVGNVTYKVGSVVPENGFYICVPCGSKRYFKAGKHFPSCLNCFGKERRFLRKGLELWERILEGSKGRE